MTAKQAFQNEKTWQRRATIVHLFHVATRMKRKWGVRDSAKYFEVSTGFIVESLFLAENLEVVKDFASRRQALKILGKRE